MSSSPVDAAVTSTIRSLLIDHFTDDPKDKENLMRVLFYLDEEDRAYRDSDRIPPVYQTLKHLINAKDKSTVDMYAKRLVEDTKRAEKDEAFRTILGQMYEQLMEPGEKPLEDSDHQGFQLLSNPENIRETTAFMGLAKAWPMIPKTTQELILENIPKIISDTKTLSCIDDIANLANKGSGAVVVVALATVQLAYVAIRDIRRWWRGEISGKRCAKNVVDTTAVLAAGAVGGWGGAAVGSLAGPVGTLVGGIGGSVLSSLAAEHLVNLLTQKLFGLPKDEALENAYSHLGVKISASNNEINTIFRKKCLEHHPDKGGSADRFIELQVNMQIIRQAREQ